MSDRHHWPPYIGSMAAPSPLETTLLPGARALLAFHARELPQRDDLCGAFCGALALRAAGIERFSPHGRADRSGRGGAGGGERRIGAAGHRQPAARRSGQARLPAGAAVRRGCRRVGHDGRRRGGRDRAARRRGARGDPLRRPVDGADARRPVRARGGARAPGDVDRQSRHPPPVGRARAPRSAARPSVRGRAERPAARLGRGALRLRVRPRAGPARHPLRRGRHLPLAGQRRRAHAAGRAPRRGDRRGPRDTPGEHPRFASRGAWWWCSPQTTPRACARARANWGCARASGTTAP